MAAFRASLAIPVVVFAGVMALWPGHEAAAHAALVGSHPADGATLETSPRVVTLTFTEPPDPLLAQVELVDENGHAVPDTRTSVSSADARMVRLTTAPLPEGAYTVIWRMVSRIDGHATAGLLTFGVGVPPLEAPPTRATAAAQEEPISPLEVAGRWTFLVGLVLVLGATTIGVTAFRAVPDAVRVVIAAGLVLGIVGLFGLAAAQRAVAQVGALEFLETTAGRAVLLRGSALAFTAVGVLLCFTASRTVVGPVVTAIGAATAAFAEVAAGHAGGSSSVAWAEVGTQWVHVVAAGVWIGGLAALLIGLRGAADPTKASAVRRFSRAAGVALIVVIATGTVRAFGELEAPRDLLATTYGRVLAAKVVSLGGVVVFAALNRYRNVPRASEGLDALRRTSRAELLLAGVVLAASALLAGLAPPASAPPARAAMTHVPLIRLDGADFATTVRVRLSVAPGGAGTNRFDARITDYDTGRPVEANRVALRFAHFGADTSRSELELRPQRAGTYAAIGENLALQGLWHLVLIVQQPNTSTEVVFDLATRCQAEPLGGGTPQVFTSPLEDGSVQGFVGGVGGGRYQVHFTFLDDRERELPIDGRAKVIAWRPNETLSEVRVTRLGQGHFVGHATLEPGRWYFEASAVSNDAGPLYGCFEEEI